MLMLAFLNGLWGVKVTSRVARKHYSHLIGKNKS